MNKYHERYRVVDIVHYETWTMGVWDEQEEVYIARCTTKAKADHIAHCLNAVHAMIASVEALP